jgi:hypothetical protein
MTPTEQDNLSIEEKVSVVLDVLIGHHLCPADENDQSCLLNISTKEISQLITADRKRVALEARIAELENNKWLPNEAKWIEQEADRIAELKAQQEEVR